jgi:hypothetical protein
MKFQAHETQVLILRVNKQITYSRKNKARDFSRLLKVE